MSKAGVLGHFRTKEELQLATLDQAFKIFSRIVLEPAERAEPGLARLRVICQEWITYLETAFPGGCLFITASIEFDSREGPVRDAVRELFSFWRLRLITEVQRALDRGELPPDTDPDQLVFEFLGLFTSLNMGIRLFADAAAAEHTRRALARMLGDV
jgi:AcrR family transcriptional regulator